MLERFIETVLTASTQMRQAFRQMGREQTLEERPGSLDFVNTFCNLLELVLKTTEVFGRPWGYVVLGAGNVVFLFIVTFVWNRCRAGQGIINVITNLCNAKTCGRRCWQRQRSVSKMPGDKGV
jgi:hypothetical protein